MTFLMTFPPPPFLSSRRARRFVTKAARTRWHICHQFIMNIAPLAAVGAAADFCASLGGDDDDADDDESLLRRLIMRRSRASLQT